MTVIIRVLPVIVTSTITGGFKIYRLPAPMFILTQVFEWARTGGHIFFESTVFPRLSRDLLTPLTLLLRVWHYSPMNDERPVGEPWEGWKNVSVVVIWVIWGDPIPRSDACGGEAICDLSGWPGGSVYHESRCFANRNPHLSKGTGQAIGYQEIKDIGDLYGHNIWGLARP